MIQYYAIPGLKNYHPVIRWVKKPEHIIRTVQAVMGLSELKERSAPNVLWRHVAIYLLKKHTSLSLKQIGQLLCKHHSSAINSINRIRGYVKVDAKIRNLITEIENEL